MADKNIIRPVKALIPYRCNGSRSFSVQGWAIATGLPGERKPTANSNASRVRRSSPGRAKSSSAGARMTSRKGTRKPRSNGDGGCPPWTFRTRSVKGKGRSAEAWYDCITLSERPGWQAMGNEVDSGPIMQRRWQSNSYPAQASLDWDCGHG
jgi:hypothetical protein